MRLVVVAFGVSAHAAIAAFACVDVATDVSADAGDAAALEEGSTRDASGDTTAPPSAAACAPDGGTPRPWVPPNVPTQACNSIVDVEEIVTCVVYPPTENENCSKLADAASDESIRMRGCRDCIVSEADAATYGALIHEDGYFRLNVNGCIAILGREPNPSCVAKEEARASCARDACRSCLANGVASFDDCVQAALDSPPCINYGDTNCVPNIAGNVDLTACRPLSDFELAARKLGAFFCAPNSAGADASASD